MHRSLLRIGDKALVAVANRRQACWIDAVSVQFGLAGFIL